ncbi:uncharacterized protein BXZ73DRAFT_106622 [Epithele typhae]|uniref:uncharacterized protein n=1 Tax=Epithele typhae TaxID=378194 RepID=UPI002008AB0E|nr:uncharacterized protein BXZ73DRAFT_106622 [Epithele typhae]KAH9914380.1 hypothetical protein BXZ73DRAFT_106622 [Epithele typhae]
MTVCRSASLAVYFQSPFSAPDVTLTTTMNFFKPAALVTAVFAATAAATPVAIPNPAEAAVAPQVSAPSENLFL